MKPICDKDKKSGTSIWVLVLAPVLAGVFSLAGVWLGNYLAQQNSFRLYEQQNQPRIIPTNVTLVAFEELDTSVAIKRTWGYATLHHPVIKDGVYTGRSRVYAELVFWDANKGERKWGNRIMTTLEDVKEEAKRLHFPQDIPLKKHYVIQFSFGNTGQLSAHDIKINIQLEDVGGKKQFQPNPISELAGGEIKKDILLHSYIDTNVILGEIEHFIITTEYKYAGKVYSRTRKLVYNMLVNEWGFE